MSTIKNFIIFILISTFIFIIKKANAISSNITLEYSKKGEFIIFQDSETKIFNTPYLDIYLIEDNDTINKKLDPSDITKLQTQEYISGRTRYLEYYKYTFQKENSKIILNIKKSLISLAFFFKLCTADNIIFDDNFDFSEMKFLNKTFYSSEAIIKIYMGTFDASKVISMDSMFSGCSSLKSLIFKPLNTISLDDLGGMFYSCSSLTSLDLSSMNTSKVTEMSYMFFNCAKLSFLNVSSFTTENCEDLRSMFKDCSSLQILDLSSFTSEVMKKIEGMFSGCTSLTSVDLSSFEGKNLQNINTLFYNCNSLQYLNISCFNPQISALTSTDTFSGCNSLKILDFSSYLGTYYDYLTNIDTLEYCKFSIFESSLENTIYKNCKIFISFENCSCDTKINEYSCEKSINGITVNMHYLVGNKDNNGQCVWFDGIDDYEFINPEDILGNIKCNIIGVVDNNKCKKCNNLLKYYQKFEEKNEDEFYCYKQTELTNYTLVNITNKLYLQKKIENGCENNYYKLENDPENKCYNEETKPKNYYLDIDLLYKKCHIDCQSCSSGKTETSTNCLTCTNITKIVNEGNCIIPNIKCLKKCKTCNEESNKNNFCIECNIEKGFISYNKSGKYTDCVNNLKPITSSNLTIKYEELTLDNIYNYLYEYYKKYYDEQKYVIKHSNEEFSITLFNVGIDNMNNSYLKYYDYLDISKIDLGDCYQKLINHYSIVNDLIYLQLDFVSNEKDINYLLYSPQLNKTLDLNICNDMKINITKNLNLDDNEINALLEAKEQGYNLLDINDKFYTNLCSKYTTSNGTDIILSDRINDIYNFDALLNYESCDFDSFNIALKTINCETTIKTEFFDNDNKNKKDYMNNINVDSDSTSLLTMKCYEIFLNTEGLSKNFGSYWYLICLILVLGVMIYYLCRGTTIIKDKLDNIIYKKKFRKKKISINNNNNNKNKYEERNEENVKHESERLKISNNAINGSNQLTYKKATKIKKKKNSNKKSKILTFTKGLNDIENKNTKRPNKKKRSSDKGKNIDVIHISNNFSKDISNYNMNNVTVFNNKNITEDKINIKDLSDIEINDLEYYIAHQYDTRKYYDYYCSLLKDKQFFLFIFNKDYNIPQIKMILFLYTLCLCLTINECFFFGSTIHKIYVDNGNYNLVYQLPRIIYSTIIFIIIIFGLKKLTLTQNRIIKFKKFVRKEAKTEEEAQKAAKNLIFGVKVKFIIICIIYLVFGVFWYFAGTFCAVYSNSQLHLIINAIISFILSMLYPFLFNLIPGFLRIYALKDPNKNSRLMYRISQIIQKF